MGKRERRGYWVQERKKGKRRGERSKGEELPLPYKFLMGPHLYYLESILIARFFFLEDSGSKLKVYDDGRYRVIFVKVHAFIPNIYQICLMRKKPVSPRLICLKKKKKNHYFLFLRPSSESRSWIF